MGAMRQNLGVVGAAVVHQVGDRLPDPGGIDAVDHVARDPAGADEARLLQRCKVKRQARGGKSQRLTDPAGGHARVAGGQQQTDQVQPRHMGERGKRRQDLGLGRFTLIHRSTIQEILK